MLLVVLWFAAVTRYGISYSPVFLKFEFDFCQAGEYYIENVLRQKNLSGAQPQALTSGLSDIRPERLDTV